MVLSMLQVSTQDVSTHQDAMLPSCKTHKTMPIIYSGTHLMRTGLPGPSIWPADPLESAEETTNCSAVSFCGLPGQYMYVLASSTLQGPPTVML